VRAWRRLLLILLTALVAATFAARAPDPAPIDAPARSFSALRAMPDVKAIAVRPHPMGSTDSRRVQAYLLGRMSSLGLEPQAHAFDSALGPGRNLIGVLPGRDRAAPAVLLMAHTDSVPAGPGAADDAVGVAAVLEAVRALKTGPRQRDVMVLLTDGEEQGLLGAKAFFAADPARAHVGLAINLEARGNRGRAVMFETHPGAGPLISALIRAHALAAASSLMPDLYRRLPNDTDLTEALKRGYPGLNFAFFAGLDAYHRPADTVRALDPGSLQSIGDQALRAARALSQGDPAAKGPAAPLPSRGPDAAYADVLGGPVLRQSAAEGWCLLILAAAGLAAYFVNARRAGRTSIAGVGGGALAFLVLIALIGAVLSGLGALRGLLAGGHMGPLLRHALGARSGAGLLMLGLALIWAAVAERWLRPDSLVFGVLKVLGAVAVALQILAPLDAFVFTWPFVLVGLALAFGGPTRSWLGALIAAAALCQILYWNRLMFDLVGQFDPAALTPFAALALAALLPIAPKAGVRTAAAGLAAAVVGLGLSLFAMRL
jgi:hypothetical protein